VDVGEYVSPASRIVSLVKTDPLRLEVQVPQQNIGAIREGQTVQLHIDAFPNETFTGTVRYISAAVRADTRGLSVEATVSNTDGRLRPGLFASARIDLGRMRETVELPSTAVLDEAGTHRAFVVVNGHISERVLTIVDRDEQHVLISEGVRAGEQVVVEGIERLADGQAVR
jgi:membrane fusion protein (multidrug efflux system)